jgi:hypothetical protein
MSAKEFDYCNKYFKLLRLPVQTAIVREVNDVVFAITVN